MALSASPAITARFYAETLLQNEASHAAGHAVFKDMELVELKFAADKNKVLVFPAHEAEPNASREAGHPVTYAEVYREQYYAFKEGLEQEASGTPLESGKEFLTAAKQRELKALNINSLEALAGLDGQPLKQIGPGGRELKDRARAYLDSQAERSSNAELLAQIAALRAENANLRGTVADVEGITIRQAKPQEQKRAERQFRDHQASQQKVEERTAAAQDRAIERSDAKWQQETEKAERGTLTASTDFDKWDDEQLKGFIAEQSGQRPRGNPSHETLVTAAKELAAAKH